MRVRFAPSPTGHLHVGGARTALFNWLLARREGGTFVLRIEDTDQERSSPEMLEAILEGLLWLGIDWDEGPFHQSRGMERHQAEVQRLLDEGMAFRDFTSPDELVRIRADDPARAVRHPRDEAAAMGDGEAEERAAAGEAHAVRFRVPPGETVWEDRVHGVTRFRNSDIEDLVLLRRDGTPTYNLAVASDDAHERITHVIRGDDHLSNTPKQILLHEALGRSVPQFAHVPMILGSDGKRLSKRHGATAVSEYRERGVLPDAMVNFLALLGWSPGTDEEVLTRSELVARFSLERVLKKSSVFDSDKLGWLNGRHLMRIPGAELQPLVFEELGELRRAAEERTALDPHWFTGLLELLKPRARSIRDLVEQARPFLLDKAVYDSEAVAKHWEKDPAGTAAHLEALRECFQKIPWEEGSLEEALRELAQDRGVGAGKLIHPLRVALTGQAVSPGIFEVLVFMGRPRALSRLEEAIAFIERSQPQDS